MLMLEESFLGNAADSALPNALIVLGQSHGESTLLRVLKMQSVVGRNAVCPLISLPSLESFSLALAFVKQISSHVSLKKLTVLI